MSDLHKSIRAFTADIVPLVASETTREESYYPAVRNLLVAVLKDLGLPEGAEHSVATAIVYFYEPFLETFDPNLRKELGVWYTPPEIVRYQVRKVDALLREELGCQLGFE